jgi:hypothetical protein
MRIITKLYALAVAPFGILFIPNSSKIHASYGRLHPVQVKCDHDKN